MSAKTDIARREAFFLSLGETANQTLAAEWARVSRSWVSLHRQTDPDFRARMDVCIKEARERLKAEAARAPQATWTHHRGIALVVRGSRGRRAQIARARLDEWTASVERDFLRTLAASCNVRLACRQVGMSVASAYVRRAKYNAFAEHWDEALRIAEPRLEMALIENATNSLEGVEVDPNGPMPKMSVMDAFMLLRAYKMEARAKHARNRWWNRKQPSIEEVRASILRKIEAIERFNALQKRDLPSWAED